jgi:DNA repair protein RadC
MNSSSNIDPGSIWVGNSELGPSPVAVALLALSVSEKLSRYGVNALSDVEHLGLLVGKETLAARLLKHFGSLKALTKASAVELGAFMTTHKAERLVAALAVSARAQAQNSFQEPFDSPETVYRSCLDMQAFQQEVLRVVLLDARFRRITAVDITKGTVNESLAHPREIFRPAISHSAWCYFNLSLLPVAYLFKPETSAPIRGGQT